MIRSVRLIAAGDAALIAELGDQIDEATNARVVALAEAVRSAAIAGVRDVVPTFRSVAIYFDPLRTDRGSLTEAVHAASQALADAPPAQAPARVVDVPVCYDRQYAPDCDEVAARTGLDPDRVAALHAGRTYRVFMLGFVPGFAYLGTLDPRLVLPRRRTPRPAVEAGSVAIAGEQTGVYPSRTPGGWHIIGRTPLEMFTPDCPGSSLLRAGDRVRFRPIGLEEFTRRSAAPESGT